jgi:hypothetical protein
MSYVPKTEEQLADEALLQEAIYDFEVIGTDDKPSKKGNEMFTLKLCVYGEDGGRRFIYDYIAMGNSFGERKLRHAADACGLLGIYDSGELKDHSFMGATGKVLLKKQDGTDGFPPKNVVSDYVKRDDAAVPEKLKNKAPAEIIGDDLPF